MQDDDLRALRERREWLEVKDTLIGSLPTSTRTTLRAEAKAPFRLARTFVFGGLGLGAAVGLAIISTRLVAIFGGAPNAPDLKETATNFAVNLAATLICGAFVLRDSRAKQRDERLVEREESLGQMQV